MTTNNANANYRARYATAHSESLRLASEAASDPNRRDDPTVPRDLSRVNTLLMQADHHLAASAFALAAECAEKALDIFGAAAPETTTAPKDAAPTAPTSKAKKASKKTSKPSTSSPSGPLLFDSTDDLNAYVDARIDYKVGGRLDAVEEQQRRSQDDIRTLKSLVETTNDSVREVDKKAVAARKAADEPRINNLVIAVIQFIAFVIAGAIVGTVIEDRTGTIVVAAMTGTITFIIIVFGTSGSNGNENVDNEEAHSNA